MVDQRSDLRLETRENRVRTLPWASSGHATTRLMSAQRRRPPILIFATKPLDWRKTHRVVAAAAHRGTRTAPCEESEPVSARRAQPEDPSLTVSCPRNSESRTVDQLSRAGPWVPAMSTGSDSDDSDPATASDSGPTSRSRLRPLRLASPGRSVRRRGRLVSRGSCSLTLVLGAQPSRKNIPIP